MPSLDFEKEKKDFRKYFDNNLQLYKQAANSFTTLVSLLLADHNNFNTPRVTSRVKDREECIKKFELKYLKKFEEKKEEYEILGNITDIIGLRIITIYESEICYVRKELEEHFEILEVTDKSESIEKKDDVFGYKGLHLDLKLKAPRNDLPEYKKFKDLQFEVQIRTIVQDAWSEVDHKIKYKRNIPHLLKRRINRLAALFELADQEFENMHRETIELEQKASEEASVENNEYGNSDTLFNAFHFLKIMKPLFPKYEFYGFKIDGFIDELRTINPELQAKDLSTSLKKNSEILEQYKRYQLNKLFNTLNPYTILRHALYLHDKEKYKTILFDLQRRAFDKWIENKEENAID